MHPLEGQPLLHLQRKLCHVNYILIDEMRFIGPKIISRIDDHLREVFPSYQNVPFDNHTCWWSWQTTCYEGHANVCRYIAWQCPLVHLWHGCQLVYCMTMPFGAPLTWLSQYLPSFINRELTLFKLHSTNCSWNLEIQHQQSKIGTFSCQGQIPFCKMMSNINSTMQSTYIQPT